MAEAGKTPIQLYHSTDTGVEPDPANLLPGELAINIADNFVWTDDGAGNLKKIIGSLGAQDADDVNITGGSITGVAVEVDLAFVTLEEQVSSPATPTGTGTLYAMASAGTTSLFYKNDDGDEIKLTEGDSINIDLPGSTITPLNTLTINKTSSRFYRGGVVDVTPVAGVATIDMEAGSTFNINLSSDDIEIDFTNMPAAVDDEGLVLWIIIKSTGTCSVTAFNPEGGFTIYKPSAADPLGTLTPNGIDVFTCSMQATQDLFIFPVFNMVAI